MISRRTFLPPGASAVATARGNGNSDHTPRFLTNQSQNFGFAMTGVAITIARCLIPFFIAQRWFIQGVVITGVKG